MRLVKTILKTLLGLMSTSLTSLSTIDGDGIGVGNGDIPVFSDLFSTSSSSMSFDMADTRVLVKFCTKWSLMISVGWPAAGSGWRLDSFASDVVIFLRFFFLVFFSNHDDEDDDDGSNSTEDDEDVEDNMADF